MVLQNTKKYNKNKKANRRPGKLTRATTRHHDHRRTLCTTLNGSGGITPLNKHDHTVWHQLLCCMCAGPAGTRSTAWRVAVLLTNLLARERGDYKLW